MTGQREQLALQEFGLLEVALRADDVRELLAAGESAIELSPTRDAGRFRISALGKVGTIATSRYEIRIRPKIPIANVLVMLEPAIPLIEFRSDFVGFGAADDVAPAVAGYFTRLATHTLNRGVLRDYVRTEDALAALRGRVRLAHQLRRHLPIPIDCEFDEYSVDIPLNRLLKAATRRLMRVPGIGDLNRDALGRLIDRLGDVRDSAPSTQEFLRRGFNRLNAYYEPAVRLASMILEERTLDHAPGGTTASAFLIDMSRVFEVFLELRVRQALRGLLGVQAQLSDHLDVERRIDVRPDLVFEDRGRAVYVADAKYKASPGPNGVQSDVYQLRAYTTAFGVDEGALIYAHGSDDVPAREIRVKHGSKTIQVRRINLGGDANALRTAAEELASWIAERASVRDSARRTWHGEAQHGAA